MVVWQFNIPKEMVEEVQPKRPPKPNIVIKSKPVSERVDATAVSDDMPGTSA